MRRHGFRDGADAGEPVAAARRTTGPEWRRRWQPSRPVSRARRRGRPASRRAGNPEAHLLRELHELHAGALWSCALTLTGDRDQAQEVTQETLLRAWRNPQILDPERGSRRRRVTFTSGTALSETQIKDLQITQPTGLPSSAWRCPPSGLQIASQATGPQPGAGICGRCARGGRRRGGPVSQGRWLVSLTRWTAANPRPCHWISLMQAEPRYSR
jgi:hypothetical protein